MTEIFYQTEDISSISKCCDILFDKNISPGLRQSTAHNILLLVIFLASDIKPTINQTSLYVSTRYGLSDSTIRKNMAYLSHDKAIMIEISNTDARKKHVYMTQEQKNNYYKAASNYISLLNDTLVRSL